MVNLLNSFVSKGKGEKGKKYEPYKNNKYNWVKNDFIKCFHGGF